MVGFEVMEFVDKIVVEQIQVVDGIQDFVFDEFVFVMQVVFVEYVVFVDYDCVFYVIVECQVL